MLCAIVGSFLNVFFVFPLVCMHSVCVNSHMFVAALLKEIDSLAEDYLNNVRTMSGETRKEHLGKIEKMFSKSKEFGDDKVQLAMQTYEMVAIIIQ